MTIDAATDRVRELRTTHALAVRRPASAAENDARRARAVRLFLVTGVLLLVAVAATLPFRALSLWVDACVVLSAIVAVRLHRQRPGVRAWRFMAIGLVLSAIANVTWDALLIAGAFGPRVETALIVVLVAGYPFMIAGATSLLPIRESFAGRGRWIDLLVFVVAGAAMVTALSGSDVFTLERLDAMNVLVAVAPLLTIAMLATSLRLVAHPARGIASYWYLVAAAFMVAAADMVYATSTLAGDTADTVASVIYGAMYLLIVAGLMDPSQRHLPRSAAADAEALVDLKTRLGRRDDGHALLVVLASQSVIPTVVGAALAARGDVSTGVLLAGIGAVGMLASLRVARLVSERERLQRRLEHAASHDRLTGLPNRGAFIGWAVQRTQPSTLLFLDLDGFKHVNDTWGHAAGDGLLVTIADRMRTIVDDAGVVARFAGDEFVVVVEQALPGSPRVRRLVENLERAVSEPVDVGAATVRVGVSIGVAELDVDDIDASLVQADTAMYSEKHTRSRRARVRDVDAA
jgi:diguanylate cyclase